MQLYLQGFAAQIILNNVAKHRILISLLDDTVANDLTRILSPYGRIYLWKNKRKMTIRTLRENDHKLIVYHVNEYNKG